MKKEKELKKRGRKPKEEYYSNKQADKVEIENKAIIINLPITIEEYNEDNNITHFSNILSDIPKKIQGYFPETFNSTFQEIEYLSDRKVVSHVPDEPLFTEIEYLSETKRISTEIYEACLIPRETEKKSNMKVDICCFWCCHSFDNPPIFMPLSYDLEKEKFKVKGIFCSFNCVLSYMNDSIKYREKKFLLNFMYKIFTGNKNFTEISPAPPRETLKIFGGPMSIEEYRDTFDKKINFTFQEYPLVYIPTQIKKTSFLVKDQLNCKINPIQKIYKKPSPVDQKVNNSLSKIIKNFR